MSRARSDRGAAKAPAKDAPKAAGGARGASDWLSSVAAKVPARIMEPRLTLILATTALVVFGLVMVYSASSVKGIINGESPSSYLVKQLIGTILGLVACVVCAKVDYHTWGRRCLPYLWVLAVLLMVVVHLRGTDSHGATRWISLGPLSFQPSEFAKIVVVVTAAAVIAGYVVGHRPATPVAFLGEAAWKVGLPVALVLFQPDKGTTLVLGAVIFCLCLMAGLPRRPLLVCAAVAVAAYLALSLKDDYSRSRFLIFLNPDSDPTGAGYQVIQSFRAFGSGGLFGTGIGMGAMKYSYLPEAHNDFILAVIGEECGLVGMVLVIALFALILWSGFRIARNAPDFFGSLLAAGSSMLIVFTFLLNLSGVIGAFPLSGKAVPFLSYGGTSMMASLLVVGTILSVSVHSRLPETVHDRRRRSLGVVRDGAPAPVPTVEGSTAGAPTARSLRLVHDSGSRGDARRGDPGAGGRSGDRGGGREGSGRDGSHPEARRTRDSSGRERIELGRSATERLRPERGPEVRERRGPSSRNTGRR
ncbi:cell division protein FtsW [Coriobacteriaceae bacterium]|nr:cell division protein FtsW [Coriobacteriaceae bacterium]